MEIDYKSTCDSLRADLRDAGRIIAALKHTTTVKLAKLTAERDDWQASTEMARAEIKALKDSLVSARLAKEYPGGA